MRFFHSYWSKPARSRWNIKNQTIANLWLFALSVVYLKLNRRQIVLHTDTPGERLLSCLPYDNIYRSLDALQETHPDFWCAGKMIAYEYEPLGNIHIDGDVLLKSEAALKRLDLTDADCVVQNIESCGDYYSDAYTLVARAYRKLDSPPPFLFWNDAYNVGTIGFANETLKRNYINDFWSVVETLARTPEIYMNNPYGDTGITLLLEQMNLKRLADNSRCRVKTLLRDWREADALDYCHVIGSQKYQPAVVNEVKNCLNTLAPFVYAQVRKREQAWIEGDLL